VGRDTSPGEIDWAIQVVAGAVRALQAEDRGYNIYINPPLDRDEDQDRVEP
jgi:hypothetical protein